MDDIRLTKNHIEKINHITYLLDQHFLGLEVARYKTGIHISKKKYILDLLNESRMLNYAPIRTPLVHTSQSLQTNVTN